MTDPMREHRLIAIGKAMIGIAEALNYLNAKDECDVSPLLKQLQGMMHSLQISQGFLLERGARDTTMELLGSLEQSIADEDSKETILNILDVIVSELKI